MSDKQITDVLSRFLHDINDFFMVSSESLDDFQKPLYSQYRKAIQLLTDQVTRMNYKTFNYRNLVNSINNLYEYNSKEKDPKYLYLLELKTIQPLVSRCNPSTEDMNTFFDIIFKAYQFPFPIMSQAIGNLYSDLFSIKSCMEPAINNLLSIFHQDYNNNFNAILFNLNFNKNTQAFNTIFSAVLPTALLQIKNELGQHFCIAFSMSINSFDSSAPPPFTEKERILYSKKYKPSSKTTFRHICKRLFCDSLLLFDSPKDIAVDTEILFEALKDKKFVLPTIRLFTRLAELNISLNSQSDLLRTVSPNVNLIPQEFSHFLDIYLKNKPLDEAKLISFFLQSPELVSSIIYYPRFTVHQKKIATIVAIKKSIGKVLPNLLCDENLNDNIQYIPWIINLDFSPYILYSLIITSCSTRLIPSLIVISKGIINFFNVETSLPIFLLFESLLVYYQIYYNHFDQAFHTELIKTLHICEADAMIFLAHRNIKVRETAFRILLILYDLISAYNLSLSHSTPFEKSILPIISKNWKTLNSTKDTNSSLFMEKSEDPSKHAPKTAKISPSKKVAKKSNNEDNPSTEVRRSKISKRMKMVSSPIVSPVKVDEIETLHTAAPSNLINQKSRGDILSDMLKAKESPMPTNQNLLSDLSPLINDFSLFISSFKLLMNTSFYSKLLRKILKGSSVTNPGFEYITIVLISKIKEASELDEIFDTCIKGLAKSTNFIYPLMHAPPEMFSQIMNKIQAFHLISPDILAETLHSFTEAHIASKKLNNQLPKEDVILTFLKMALSIRSSMFPKNTSKTTSPLLPKYLQTITILISNLQDKQLTTELNSFKIDIFSKIDRFPLQLSEIALKTLTTFEEYNIRTEHPNCLEYFCTSISPMMSRFRTTFLLDVLSPIFELLSNKYPERFIPSLQNITSISHQSIYIKTVLLLKNINKPEINEAAKFMRSKILSYAYFAEFRDVDLPTLAPLLSRFKIGFSKTETVSCRNVEKWIDEGSSVADAFSGLIELFTKSSNNGDVSIHCLQIIRLMIAKHDFRFELEDAFDNLVCGSKQDFSNTIILNYVIPIAMQKDIEMKRMILNLILSKSELFTYLSFDEIFNTFKDHDIGHFAVRMFLKVRRFFPLVMRAHFEKLISDYYFYFICCMYKEPKDSKAFIDSFVIANEEERKKEHLKFILQYADLFGADEVKNEIHNNIEMLDKKLIQLVFSDSFITPDFINTILDLIEDGCFINNADLQKQFIDFAKLIMSTNKRGLVKRAYQIVSRNNEKFKLQQIMELLRRGVITKKEFKSLNISEKPDSSDIFWFNLVSDKKCKELPKIDDMLVFANYADDSLIADFADCVSKDSSLQKLVYDNSNILFNARYCSFEKIAPIIMALPEPAVPSSLKNVQISYGIDLSAVEFSEKMKAIFS